MLYTNSRPGLVIKLSTMVSKYKLETRAGNTSWGPGPINPNWEPGPVNTNWMSGPVNTNWMSGPVNANLGPGPVNTNWEPGPGAKQTPQFSCMEQFR